MKVYIRFELDGTFVSAHTTLESAQDSIPDAAWVKSPTSNWWSNVNTETRAGHITEHEVIE